MRIADIKRINRQGYNDLSLQNQKNFRQILRDIDSHAVNALDYELIKGNLLGMFKEAAMKGQGVDKKLYLHKIKGEIISKAKNRTVLEYIINTMPKVILSILLFYCISYVIYNSLPSKMDVTISNLVFWVIIGPLVTVAYQSLGFKRRIKSRKWLYKAILLVFTVLSAVGACYISRTLYPMVILWVKGYYPVLILIALWSLFQLIYELYYINYAKDYDLLNFRKVS